MHISSILTVLATVGLAAAQDTGKLGDAKVVTNNPAGAVYTATLPNRNTTNIRGTIVASSTRNGTGVVFNINVRGFPTAGGPFIYHIHDQPVPANGNCTATLAHLDPFIRGEVPVCDPAKPATCQVGDLSGKFGKIASDPFVATYTDNYVSLASGVGAFIGNRSIVFHYANTTRITCANFVASNSTSPNGTVPSGTGSSGPTVTATGTSRGPSGTGSAPVTTYTGAAAAKAVSLGAAVLAVAAFAL